MLFRSKPLSKIGHVNDVDRFLNPLAFYTGRLSMLAVTGLFAAVDRAGVAFVRRCYWIGNNPVLAVERVARRLPWVDPSHQTADGGEPSRLYLRTSIGGAILLTVLVLTIVLFVLVFL